VKIRLEGLPEECALIAGRLPSIADVVSVSDPYPNRGASRLVRVYVELRTSYEGTQAGAGPVRGALPPGGER
jgi:hypothetical protein